MTGRFNHRRTIYFCFANPAGFSGQKAATELVVHGLAQRGWRCWRLPQPVLDRTNGGRFAVLFYLGGLLAAWARSLRLVWGRGAWLCVNLGQTRAAFLRDAVPLLLGRLFLGKERVVVSLHGSVFMGWNDESLDTKIFRSLLRNAGRVTVLGAKQRGRLLALGLSAERVVVVTNSCDMVPITAREIQVKQLRSGEGDSPIRCLYLSSLIDTKGFPEYMEALLRISEMNDRAIDAVICGCIVGSEFSERFAEVAAAEAWIEQKIEVINRSAGVRVRWVKGARGAEKEALFRQAQIFVLPTRYAVEAQPLVLLEAMAAGCAIITTQVGEIPTILDEESAIMLSEATSDAVADAMTQLVLDSAQRLRLALSAHSRFLSFYQRERHFDTWEKLLGLPGAAAEGISQVSLTD